MSSTEQVKNAINGLYFEIATADVPSQVVLFPLLVTNIRHLIVQHEYSNDPLGVQHFRNSLVHAVNLILDSYKTDAPRDEIIRFFEKHCITVNGSELPRAIRGVDTIRHLEVLNRAHMQVHQISDHYAAYLRGEPEAVGIVLRSRAAALDYITGLLYDMDVLHIGTGCFHRKDTQQQTTTPAVMPSEMF